MRWGQGDTGDLGVATIENRSSSESGYGTSVGDTRGETMESMEIRGDTRQLDNDLDEVFYLEEEEFPLQHFQADKSHICVGLSSGQVQYKPLS